MLDPSSRCSAAKKRPTPKVACGASLGRVLSSQTANFPSTRARRSIGLPTTICVSIAPALRRIASARRAMSRRAGDGERSPAAIERNADRHALDLGPAIDDIRASAPPPPGDRGSN